MNMFLKSLFSFFCSSVIILVYFSVYAVALVLSNVRTISRGGRKKYYRKIDVEANHKVGEKTDCKRKSSDAEDSFENTATTYILMQS